MNQRITAAILAASAVMLAAGAYILFTHSEPEMPVYRHAVAPPPATAPEAPSWVGTGQEAKPDYTAADTEAQNATPVSDEPTKVIEVSEDSVVTFTFVESLVNFTLNRFQPVGQDGRPASTANAKTINTYFGRELDGFMVNGDNLRAARKRVLDYAFTPKVIDTLYSMYIPLYLDQLVESAMNDERDYSVGVEKEKRTLTKAETRSMLRVNAANIKKTAIILKGIAANPSITKLAGNYLQANKAVDRANSQLQEAIADEKDLALPGKRLKQAILQREEIQKSLASTLKKSCPGASPAESFYLAQWSYRRVLGETETELTTFETAAKVLQDMAERFRATADEL